MVGREEPSGLSQTLGIVITTYANPLRLDRMLDLVPSMPVPIRVFEDPSTDEIHETYKAVCRKRQVPIFRSSKWGCMQGIAQFAFEESLEDWLIYLPDDAPPSRGALESLVWWCQNAPSHVGAIQSPYWNYEELFEGKHRDQMFEGGMHELYQVRWNPHWWGPAFYINVNGAGFAVRRKVWEEVGGFNQKTWCLDEDLSCKIWLRTNYTIITVPGPPFIHQGGATTADQHKFGHAHLKHSTMEGWMEAWGQDKEELGKLCREEMVEAGRLYGWPVR